MQWKQSTIIGWNLKSTLPPSLLQNLVHLPAFLNTKAAEAGRGKKSISLKRKRLGAGQCSNAAAGQEAQAAGGGWLVVHWWSLVVARGVYFPENIHPWLGSGMVQSRAWQNVLLQPICGEVWGWSDLLLPGAHLCPGQVRVGAHVRHHLRPDPCFLPRHLHDGHQPHHLHGHGHHDDRQVPHPLPRWGN